MRGMHAVPTSLMFPRGRIAQNGFVQRAVQVHQVPDRNPREQHGSVWARVLEKRQVFILMLQEPFRDEAEAVLLEPATDQVLCGNVITIACPGEVTACSSDVNSNWFIDIDVRSHAPRPTITIIGVNTSIIAARSFHGIAAGQAGHGRRTQGQKQLNVI